MSVTLGQANAALFERYLPIIMQASGQHILPEETVPDIGEISHLGFAQCLDLIARPDVLSAPDLFEDHLRLAINNLVWMCKTGIAQADEMPEDKANRWLGFIHGCMTMRGLIDTHSPPTLGDLSRLCKAGIEHKDASPETNGSVLLGYIQGCLAIRGLIDVDEERNITRPMFHNIHRLKTGQTPRTLARK